MKKMYNVHVMVLLNSWALRISAYRQSMCVQAPYIWTIWTQTRSKCSTCTISVQEYLRSAVHCVSPYVFKYCPYMLRVFQIFGQYTEYSQRYTKSVQKFPQIHGHYGSPHVIKIVRVNSVYFKYSDNTRSKIVKNTDCAEKSAQNYVSGNSALINHFPCRLCIVQTIRNLHGVIQ